MVGQLIEAILAVRPVPVELAEGFERMVGVGHQHGVFLELALDGISEQQGLLVRGLDLCQQLLLEPPP